MESGSLTDAYAERLKTKRTGWKKWVDVQMPYRWNLRRLELGKTLDVGCGVGRNLSHLPPGSKGVDPNRACVVTARELGCDAFTPEEFKAPAESFDTILYSHVLEHVTRAQAVALVRDYLSYLRTGGKVVMINPQQAGYRSDATHVEYVDASGQASIARDCGLKVTRQFSFPFPAAFGNHFKYNEFVLIAQK